MADTTNAVKRGEDMTVTEIVEADFSKVAGVTAPANRTPYVLLKTRSEAGEEPAAKAEEAAKEALDAVQSRATEMAELLQPYLTKAVVPESLIDAAIKGGDGEPHEEDTNSPEANEQQEEMTDSAAKASVYCGDPECEPCQKAAIVPYKVFSAHASGVSKATLRAADRKEMSPSKFAYVDPEGGKHLPIHDEAHVHAALGRFSQQDFSGAKDPAKAKAKAAGKIKAAASKFGMQVDDDSDVAQAMKGVVQEALGGTNAPEYAGTIDGSKQSIQPATGGVRTDLGSVVPSDQDPSSVPGVIARLRGGQSAYEIPAEAQAYTVKNPGPTGPQIAHVGAVKAVSSLFEAMGQIGAQREAVKAGSYLQVPGPSPAESAAPGSMPWESYDAATLDQVAAVLAQCCNAVESICTREQIEALSGDAGDQADAWSLQDAACCLDQAMGIVARLAYAEGAEAAKSGEVEKAYPRLRVGDEKALRDAHAAITNVLAEHERAKGKGASVEAGSSEPSEGDKIQMELTKEELADLLDQRIAKAQKADRKAAKKAAEDAAKEAKRQAKKAAERALKNANNGGDISAQQMEQGVGGEHDANDLKSFGGKVMPQYINKQLKQMKKAAKKAEQAGAVAKQLESLQSDLAAVGETVQKFANRPRSGGPVLDGIPRGALAAASEGRVVAQDSQGSDVDSLVKSLREKIDQSSDPVERQALGYQASLALLKQQALSEFGAGNGPFSSALGQQ